MTRANEIEKRIARIVKLMYPYNGTCMIERRKMADMKKWKSERIRVWLEGIPEEGKVEFLITMEEKASNHVSEKADNT